MYNLLMDNWNYMEYIPVVPHYFLGSVSSAQCCPCLWVDTSVFSKVYMFTIIYINNNENTSLVNLPPYQYTNSPASLPLVGLWCLTSLSTISWWSFLLVEETGLSEENHRLLASHWQTLSHNVVSTEYSSPWTGSNWQL